MSRLTLKTVEIENRDRDHVKNRDKSRFQGIDLSRFGRDLVFETVEIFLAVKINFLKLSRSRPPGLFIILSMYKIVFL
jgi:hypothetical protein